MEFHFEPGRSFEDDDMVGLQSRDFAPDVLVWLFNCL